MVWLDECRDTLEEGGGGLGKGQRVEGVKWRGQKVTGWTEKISSVLRGAVTGRADVALHLVGVGLEVRGKRVGQ